MAGNEGERTKVEKYENFHKKTVFNCIYYSNDDNSNIMFYHK